MNALPSEALFHKATIAAVARLYDNEDSLLAVDCMEAMREDRPAYWTSAGASNALGYMASIATRNEASLLRVAAMAARNHGEKRMKQCGLNTLIPLNAAAEQELSHAYARYGDFIPEDELAIRRVRKAVA